MTTITTAIIITTVIIVVNIPVRPDNKQLKSNNAHGCFEVYVPANEDKSTRVPNEFTEYSPQSSMFIGSPDVGMISPLIVLRERTLKTTLATV